MKRLLLLATALLFTSGYEPLAQVMPCPSTGNPYNVNAGPDQGICKGSCATLTASANLIPSVNYTVDTMTYAPYSYTAGTSAGITQDDQYSSVISLPFPFCFYGNTYNSCVIGGNGQINFNTTLAGQYCPWPISGGLPTGAAANAINNAIMGAYYDIQPANGGTIKYTTYGVAPCRKFVVSYSALPMFNCTNITGTQQIVLHETTGEINVHIESKPSCSNWNGNQAIVGVQNATGTAWTAPTGYNGGSWTVTNKSWAFVPPTNITYVWKNALGAVIGNGPTITVCPPNSTSYTLEGKIVRGCDTFTSTDVVNVNVTPVTRIDSLRKTDPQVCGGLGNVRIYGLTPSTAFQLKYVAPSGPVSINIIVPASGPVVLSLPAGTYNYFAVTNPISGCVSDSAGPITLINPPITAAYTYTIKYGCDQDTVIFQNNSATPGGLTQRWEFGDGSAADTSKNPTHIYPNQGIFTVKLLVTNGACTDSNLQQIDLLHPLVASFTQSLDSACQGATVAFTNTSTTTTRLGIAPKYFWSFGDGGTDTVASPTHTYTRAGVFTVVQTVRDFVPCVDTATSIVVIDSIPFVRFTVSDSTVCEGQAITFTGDYLKLNSTGITWSFGDGTFEVQDRNPAAHGYEGPGTYTVRLTAAYRICPDTFFERPVTVRPFTSINIGPDTSICPGGEPLLISARLSDGSLVGPGNPVSGDALVRWSTGDTAASILVRHHGDYWAVADLAGCTSADSVHIAKDCYLDLPNSFTPNGDGTNDYFWPRQMMSEGIVRFSMSIYNRWGQKVWETTRVDGRGWDGKFNGQDQPTGVYIYMVEAELSNGYREKYQGNVTILR